MRSGSFSLVALMSFVVLIGGCNPGADTPPVSNDLAEQVLGDTIWGDPGGNIQLVFDSDGVLSSITGAAVPEELSALNFDGQPCVLPIPQEFAGEFGVDSITLSLEPTSCTLTEAGDGSGNLEMEMSFTANADVGIPFVSPTITATVSGTMEPTADGYVLSGLEGEMELEILGTTIPLTSGAFAGGIPVTQL